ncbi:MAG TPA: SAM-dependent methyltransferase [Trebonia sp.]|jgi:methyltransferase (TIGR00027 family)|nr:SAM-dependent methyltransferase [Trebonia sp.]
MPDKTDWDVVTGVGLTALGAAAIRAIEGHHPEPLVSDPYAAAFVRAAGQLPRPLPVTPEEADADPDFPWYGLARYLGVRSKFFDGFFAAATQAAGIRQVVILAAGLDTRAFRLGWPDGMTLHEIDKPLVISFKNSVLAGEGAIAGCERRTAPCDLRDDWATALLAAGFDPARPTAWLAEGLFMYLPDEAKDALLASVDRLSAAGSRVAIEHVPSAVQDRGTAAGSAVVSRVDDDLAGLWATEYRHDPVAALRTSGWTVTADLVPDVAERYGRPLTDVPLASQLSSVLVTGVKPALENP